MLSRPVLSPLLNNRVTFYIVPESTMLSIQANAALRTGKESAFFQQLVTEAGDSLKEQVDVDLHNWSILSVMTSQIDFHFTGEDDRIHPILKLLRCYWQESPRDFEAFLSLPDKAKIAWVEAWRIGQVPVLMKESAPGDRLGIQDREALLEPEHPLP